MRTWPLLALALALPCTALAGPPAPAPASEPGASETAARVEALSRVEPRDDGVQRPLAIARRALDSAREARARGAGDEAERHDRLALAAVELAEARLRWVRERALREATARRRREAEQALARARVEAGAKP